MVRKLLMSFIAAAFACACASAMAQADNDMTPMTPEQTAKAKAERDAARAKWAAMSPSDRAAAKKAAQSKRLADATELDKVANDDMTAMTPDESAKAKAERDAAKGKWAAMSPADRAAMRKAARQKKLSDLNELEKIGDTGQ
jgi:hypothetical protein